MVKSEELKEKREKSDGEVLPLGISIGLYNFKTKL